MKNCKNPANFWLSTSYFAKWSRCLRHKSRLSVLFDDVIYGRPHRSFNKGLYYFWAIWEVWLTELRLIPDARLWLDSSLLNFWSKEKDGWLDPTEFKLLRLPTPGIFSRAARISSPSTVLSLLSTIFPLEWGTVFSGEPDSPDVWP